jgi:hypothetical protein
MGVELHGALGTEHNCFLLVILWCDAPNRMRRNTKLILLPISHPDHVLQLTAMGIESRQVQQLGYAELQL